VLPGKLSTLVRHSIAALYLSFAFSTAAVLFSASASAQQAAQPAWLRVAVVEVKGGRGPEFADLLKDFIAARQAAGLPGGQVFQIVLGHPNEFHYVTPVQSIAEQEGSGMPMPPGQAAVWTQRITETTDSVRFFYAATYPQHGVQPPANAPNPTLLMLRKIRVAQGMEAEYESWVTDQYMPAFRQSSPLGHVMSRGVYGDSLQHYYHAYPLAGWADLDAPDPLIEILGQRRYDQVFGALDDIVVDHEMVIGRIRTDLMGQ
jgi:hypothetical protein